MLGLGIGLTSRAVIGGGGAVAAWTPLDLGVKLKAWWNADDHGTANMTDDGAGVISAWKDRVGAMSTTATTTARPTWSATGFNGTHPGVVGDGAASALVSTSLGTIPTGATAGEIWMLLSYTGPSTSTHYALKYGAGAATTTERVVQHFVSTTSRFRVNDGVTNLTDISGILFEGPHIVGSIYNGTTMAGRLDGRDTNPATATIATLATGTTRLRLFANNGGSAGTWWFGPIRHAMITLDLTATEREKLEGYFAWDVALTSLLPSGHPYKSAAP